MSKFRATVRRLTELPWEDFRNLFTWPSKSTVQAENPNLLIASACDASGEALCYAGCEQIYLVDGYTFNPSVTERETEADMRRAGDEMDRSLSSLAQQSGIGRMLIVIPPGEEPQPGEKYIRVCERKFPQAMAATQRFDISTPTLTEYVN